MSIALPSWLIVVLFSIAAVALLVLGLSLTLMVKGHHIESEISTNPNMRRMGIKCAVQEAREQMGEQDCATGDTSSAACSGNCAACDIEHGK